MELYEQLEKNFDSKVYNSVMSRSPELSDALKKFVHGLIDESFSNYKQAVEIAKKNGNYGTPEADARYEMMAAKILGECSQNYVQLSTMIEHMILGLWLDQIGCAEDQWVSCPGHPLIDQRIMVSEDKEITIHEVDRHITSVPRSACEVLRFNKDNNLACLPAGVMMYVFETQKAEKPIGQNTIMCWINKWPWQPTIPMTMNIFKDTQSGIISDITGRYGFLDNDIVGHMYTPRGTSMYPAVVPTYASKIPEDRLRRPQAEKSASEMSPEEINKVVQFPTKE